MRASKQNNLLLGLDIGSTTVKYVVTDAAAARILMSDYRRHETRPAEVCLEMLRVAERELGSEASSGLKLFLTGSGGQTIARKLGALYVHEVNAMCLAVQAGFPETGSVIELGGQDAKMMIFADERPGDAAAGIGRRLKMASMNDKCAGGTGVIIDKIAAKLGLSPERIAALSFDASRVHPVAGKCGVFAETDITGLLKQGVCPEELMISLFDAIVMQNLSVLTRGHTLKPTVLLLGGPNYFLPGLQACWRYHLERMWHERNRAPAAGSAIEPRDRVRVPELARYFAAWGAAIYGRMEACQDVSNCFKKGVDKLARYIETGRRIEKNLHEMPALVESDQAREAFERAYAPPAWQAPTVPRDAPVDVYIGLDGGSTSTKAVLLDRQHRLIVTSYCLSFGNPIEDARRVILDISAQMSARGHALNILGLGVTGYAKDILAPVLGADIAVVETVAHAMSGRAIRDDVNVIVDVGGQDIKLIYLQNGAVKDFRLNTQCSAGNGYFLQATAERFGIPVEAYAKHAFTARAMPQFSYGCAIFLQTDIVEFQKQGWRPNEILAGLAAVLPKNIWFYVAQMPNMTRLGRVFILQGGTQRNMAAVKAQVDFIHERFAASGAAAPQVLVHPHAGEAGAIGAAMELAGVRASRGERSAFIGLDALSSMRYASMRNEETRCAYCKNRCLRTFIDIQGQGGATKRLIVAGCEKGSEQDVRAVKRMVEVESRAVVTYPNLAKASLKILFEPNQTQSPPPARPTSPRWWQTPGQRKKALWRATLARNRHRVRIGMPRALIMYMLAPFFTGYFTRLGVRPENLVWSAPTTTRMFKEGTQRGSIDPCYPCKLGLAHTHHLLHVCHKQRRLTHIFFPMVDTVPSAIENVLDSRICPAITATPDVVHAAMTQESSLFLENDVIYKRTFLHLNQVELCAYELWEDWRDDLGISQKESHDAVLHGLSALIQYQAQCRRQGLEVIRQLEKTGRLGIVLLGRSYHMDPGIYHGILDMFQMRGYPILTPEHLPVDASVLRDWGRCPDAASAAADADASASLRGIDDVWKNSFSDQTNRKIWAAKLVARHPLLIPLELSSFRCGHDAPLYSTVEAILNRAAKPLILFRDIDENKPAGAIKIRVETAHYFLCQYARQPRPVSLHIQSPSSRIGLTN